MKTIFLIFFLSIQILAQSTLNLLFSDDEFTPTDVTSATLWALYEYDDLDNITISGDSVASWLDKSGNGHTLTAPSSSARPKWSITTGITFDGANDQLLASADASLIQPTTIYAVIKNITWTNADYIWDGNTFLSMALADATSTPRVLIRTSANFAFDNLTLDTWFVVRVVYNSTSSSIRLNNGTATTGNAGTTNAGGFKLGCDGTGGSASNIGVKYIAIYQGTPSASDDAKIIKYLNDKASVY